jgi:putative ABC transport system permease protein
MGDRRQATDHQSSRSIACRPWSLNIENMIKNYLKIAWRSLLKYKGFSFINIFGLATGMACSLLIFLFVKDELSYDRYHKDAERIYRVVKDFVNDDGSRIPDATSPTALAQAMQREIPEVETVTRLFPNWGGSWVVEYGNKKISEQKFWRADSNFFDVFTYSFIKGNPKTALNDVSSVVITESVAKRYFGKEDPMGKIFKISCCGGALKVTAVIKDIPANSHFHFDLLSPFRQLNADDANWDSYNYYTYARVKPGTNIAAFTKKIQETYFRNQKDKYSIFYVQPLTNIHLTSHLKWELEPNGDRLYVYVFAIIGLFILLIAAINYINLSTAKSSLRTKEIGVRKVSGAMRGSLIKQFLFESLVICFLSSLLAIVIAQLLIPMVNNITLKQLSVIGNPLTLGFMILAALFVGLIAGLFPALYLSSFKPILVLKGLKLNERGALTLRKALVVVQFTISSVLIIGALIIAQQMKFIQNAKLGIDKEQVIVIKHGGSMPVSDRDAYLNTIKRIPTVKKAASGSFSMGEGFSTTRMKVKGSDKEIQMNFTNVGFDYMNVVGLEMKEGRGFSANYPADTMNNGIPNGPLDQNVGGIVINETAVKEFGLGSPAIGKQFLWGNDGDTSYYLSVVGVTKDFHFTSLRNEIKPFGFICRPRNGFNFTVKLSADNIKTTLGQLEKEWKNFHTDAPFEYVFLDDTFSKLYASEARFQKLFISLVILGIMIACLGLLGLATFAAQQRIKEIGVRKVLGASVPHVVGLLSKDFLKLVVIALIAAVPIAWYLMNQWLNDFAYRVNIQWWIFLLAAIIAIIIAFITISFQAIKAAIANPVKSLRTE